MSDNLSGDSLPPLSFLMPVLNEEDDVERAIRSVQHQRYPAPTEIVIALGPCVDGTEAIVRRLAATDPRLRVVPIHRANIPTALNQGLAACRYPIVARVDAHVELPDCYAEPAVLALLQHEAANVGGIMVAVGRSPFQRAVAAAYNSRWGLGGAAYHLRDTAAGEGESTYLGVMRAAAVAEVGGFDESLDRGEDWELNHRLRRAGQRVWIEPSLRVAYFPRTRPVALAQQFWATGASRAELVRRLGSANSRRYLAPPLLVTTAAAAVVLELARRAVKGRTLRGHRVLDGLALLAAAGPTVHAGVISVVAVRQSDRPADAVRLAAVLGLMHYSWGAGFIVSFLPGARQMTDRSRVRHRRVRVGQPPVALAR